MVEVNGLKFATSIGVVYALKEARGHETLQQTYGSLENTSMDAILEVLRASCEKGQKKSMSEDEFLCLIEEHSLGYVKLSSIYSQVVEGLMYDGMSEKEIAEAKKLAQERKLKT